MVDKIYKNNGGKVMKYIFNSKGKHIANFVNGQLHAPSGKNIGHYLQDKNIFIDMHGKYLGEIIMNERLMYKINSPYILIDFGNYGNAGNYGNPGNHGTIGSISGYKDVSIT